MIEFILFVFYLGIFAACGLLGATFYLFLQTGVFKDNI